MTLPRIQELESLGFEWGVCVTAWEGRLSELADYCTIHEHCNVPNHYSENPKLGKWVADRLSYPGIGELWFRMGGLRHRLGRPFERVC